jgi:hypothetical protein
MVESTMFENVDETKFPIPFLTVELFWHFGACADTACERIYNKALEEYRETYQLAHQLKLLFFWDPGNRHE